MVEKIIIAGIILLAVGFSVIHFRNIAKGNAACSSCGNDCNCCASNISQVIKDEDG